MLSTRPLKENEKQILLWVLKKVKRNERLLLLALFMLFYVMLVIGLFSENPPVSFHSGGYTLIRTFVILLFYIPLIWIFIRAVTFFTIWWPIKKDIKNNTCSITTMLMTENSEHDYFVGSYTVDSKRKYAKNIRFTKKTRFYVPESAVPVEKPKLKTSDVYQYIKVGRIYEVEFAAASHIIFSIKELNAII